jgi:uncharacterized membrane protein HdeD (DUF308 family)/alpha-beta hydrolase superfamily lysophospholipase
VIAAGGSPSDRTTPGQAARWGLLVLGVLCVLLGAVLTLRPFASLAVLVLLVAAGLLLTGVTDLLRWRSTRDRSSLLSGVLWLVAGIAVLAWPGLTVRTLAVVLGVALVLGGVVRIAAGLRGTRGERVAAVLLGAAAVVLGVLALAWPDVTVFVVAVVFGVRLVLYGLAQVAVAVRGRGHPGAEESPRAERRTWWRRWLATVGAAAALLVALALLAVSVTLHRDTPVPDAFYDAPADLPDQPGRLLRAEPFTRALPDGAQAWRILHTTTGADGDQVTASAIVVAPANRSTGDLPVVAWAHGTTGVARGCAPSVLEDPFEAGATPALDRVVDNGWVMVATDYVGLGSEGEHAYLVGPPAGRAVLDAVRAARQLDDVSLGERTVVWGHSQGGHSALWAGALAPDYAPDAGVVGVAAMAPASNLPGLVANLDEVPGGALFASYVMEGYAVAYDDVRYQDYVRPSARVLVRELAARCLAEKSVAVSIVESLLLDRPVFTQSPTSGRFGDRLEANVPAAPIEAPLLLAQGEADQLVLPAAQADYVAQRCAAYGDVDYRTYAGRDHVPLVEDDSPLIPELLEWTGARFDDEAPTPNCS